MTVEILPLGFSRRDRRRFVQVPFDLLRDEPCWAPPLRFDHMNMTNPKRNPFFEHARVQHFVARDGSRTVGRVAAIVNARHNEVHDERSAHFGWFEADRAEVASRLLETACDWARDEGMDRILGPESYSTNDVCGLLIEGFDSPPAILMPYNPPVYAEWIEDAGFRKAKDLLALWLTGDDNQFSPRMQRVVDRITKRARIRLRTMDMKRFDDEVAIIRDLYNRSWESNWGFVPMTEAELTQMAKDLRPIVAPECVLFAEIDGRPIGFSLAIPDLNRVLVHNRSGRLFPFTFLKLMRAKKRLREIRLITLGVLPEYRRQGVDAALMNGAVTYYVGSGRDRCEASWILEDNRNMLVGLEEHMGAKRIKRYRIYEKAL